MRRPWTSGALAFLLALMLANQYPLWGASDPPSTSTDWGLSYLFGAGISLVAAIVLWTMKRPADQCTAAGILAFGFYVNFLLMALIDANANAVDTDTPYLAGAAIWVSVLGAMFLATQLVPAPEPRS